MSVANAVDLTGGQQDIVETILRRALPDGTRIAVFGSRATQRARAYSDLDLAVDAGRPLSLDETAAVREAFSESDLPWKVDFVDVWGISETFRSIIAATAVPILVIGPD